MSLLAQDAPVVPDRLGNVHVIGLPLRTKRWSVTPVLVESELLVRVAVRKPPMEDYFPVKSISQPRDEDFMVRGADGGA